MQHRCYLSARSKVNTITEKVLHIGYMDTLAAGDSPLHKLDPRAKLIVTLLFIVAVVSFDKYTILALMPFIIYPVVLIALGGLPLGYILRAVLLVSPVAVAMAIFNPLIDTNVLVRFGNFDISGGWISFGSIIMRFALTVTAVIALVSLTGFNAVCEALISFGVPKPFVIQLQLFNRYMFVLAEEAGRMVLARKVRSFNKGSLGYKVFISLIGHLLLRTLDRADRIYRAMCCRGFNGHIYVANPGRFGYRETVFILAWVLVFAGLRFYNIPVSLGNAVMRII